MVKDKISFPDFEKLDLRVGRVNIAKTVEGSDRLVRMDVDFGSDYGIQAIFAGISRWYNPSEIQGKSFIFVTNLIPKKMMGEESHGMMLCADTGEKAVILPVSDDLTPGTVVR